MPYLRQATSLHSNGSILVWDLAQGRHCCELALPPSYTSSSPCLTTSSQCTMVIGQEVGTAEPVTALFCWDLASAEPLRRLWLEEEVEGVEGRAPDSGVNVAVGPFDHALSLLSKSSQEERCATHSCGDGRCTSELCLSPAVTPCTGEWRRGGQSTEEKGTGAQLGYLLDPPCTDEERSVQYTTQHTSLHTKMTHCL